MSRFTFWSALALVLAACVGAVWVNMPPPMAEVDTYEVAPGDTLWRIAGCLDLPEDVDVRDAVSWMADRSSSSLTVGQAVPLPYTYTEGSASCQ